MLNTVNSYLLRPVTDDEAKLGTLLIDELTRLGGEGLTDTKAEVAMMVMLALYAHHRDLCGDRGALKRMHEGAQEILRREQHKTIALRTGDDFKRQAVSEYERGDL